MADFHDVPDELLSQIILSVKADSQQDCFGRRIEKTPFPPDTDPADAPFYTLDHGFCVPSVSSAALYFMHADHYEYISSARAEQQGADGAEGPKTDPELSGHDS